MIDTQIKTDEVKIKAEADAEAKKAADAVKDSSPKENQKEVK